jgi:hypothetical protein
MTIPEDELQEIDKFSAEHGYTRSGFLVRAAKRVICAVTARQTSEPRLTREEWRTHMMRRKIANLTAEMERLDQEAKANTAGFKNKLIDATFAQSDAEADDPLAELELLLRLTPEADLSGPCFCAGGTQQAGAGVCVRFARSVDLAGSGSSA